MTSINIQGNMSHYIRNAKNNLSQSSRLTESRQSQDKTRQGELHCNYVVLGSSSNRGMSCMIGNVLSVLPILLEMYLVTFPR